jgi:prepilin-type N-terminal cleavage/methylation domain-containing protein
MMRGHKGGFTLIEVLLAVVVLSTGIGFVLFGLNNALDALRVSRTNMRAHLILKERIGEIERDGLPSTTHGKCSGRNSDFAFEIETAPLPESYDGSLSEVTITLWRRNEGVRYSTTTYVRDNSSEGYIR